MIVAIAVCALLAFAAALWPLRAYRAAGGGARPVVLIATLALAASAVAAYAALGRPGLEGAGYAGRMEALIAKGRADPAQLSVGEALALWREFARRRPDDPRPPYEAGLILARAGAWPDAVREFDASLRRAPGDPQVMVQLGGALFRSEGRVSAEALALFKEAGRLQPDAFLPVFYQAIAATEEDRHSEAAALWEEVARRLPADDPRQAMAAQMRTRALEGVGAGAGSGP